MARDDCVIGFDLGGTKLLGGIVDHDLGVRHRALRQVVGLDQQSLVETVLDAVAELREAAPGEIAGVGFGIPCLIDQRTGQAVMAVNLPIEDMPFRALMAERIGLPVFVDNDANVTALAEQRHGAAKGSDHVVCLTIGTGIGGGLVLGGELYRGSIGSGAELGHMVIDVNGPKCQGNCPNHGCLEAVASGTALVREARELAAARPDSALGRVVAEGRELTGPLVTELAHDGDPAAIEVIRIIGERLGVGISNYVNVLNPDVVVVGGGVIAAGDLLLGPARAVVAERALRPSKDHVRIVPAHFAHEAGMIGAATLAWDELRATERAAV